MIFGRSADILPAIPEVRQGDTADGQRQANQQFAAVQAACADDVRSVGISERSNFLQEFRLAGQVGDDAQEIHSDRNGQADSQSAAPDAGGDAEADACQFNLQQKERNMQQGNFLPRNGFPDGGNGADGEQDHIR